MAPTAFDGQGHRLDLGPRLGRGGEGEVFEVAGQPHVAAKLLHAGRTQGKAEKLEAMVRSPPAGAYGSIDGFPVLTWPRGLLYATPTARGSGLQGYTMTRVRPADFVPFYQLTSSGRRGALGGQPITWDRLLLLGLRICHVVRTLHRFGYAVGDLNDRNVLVSRRLTPLLMDTDSFQVPKPSGRGHFPSIVGDAQYWPPELLEVDLARHTGSRVSGDQHALAVLLFQLFMDGYRPYQATGSAVAHLESLDQKTKAGHYPWASPRRGVLEPPAAAPDYQALPKPIRRLFERCFVDGHRKPKHRPTADEWHAALREVQAEGFQACRRSAGHVFGSRERSCPWCGDRNDRFTARKAAPRPAPRPAPARPAVRLVQRPAATPAASSKRRPAAKASGRKAPPQRPFQAPQTPAAMVTLVAKPAPKPAPTKGKARAKAAPRQVVRVQRRRGKKRKARAAWVAYTLMAAAAGLLALTAL